MGRLIDAAAGSSGEQVLLSATFFVGVTAFFQVARFVKRWFIRDQFNRIACDLRQTFLERMLGRSPPDLEKETVGDLMPRMVGDITLVVDTVTTTLNEGWDTWLLMISYFTALMLLDWHILDADTYKTRKSKDMFESAARRLLAFCHRELGISIGLSYACNKQMAPHILPPATAPSKR